MNQKNVGKFTGLYSKLASPGQTKFSLGLYPIFKRIVKLYMKTNNFTVLTKKFSKEIRASYLSSGLGPIRI